MATGRFLAIWSTFVTATFAYLGTELVGVTVGEAQNPRRTVPKVSQRLSPAHLRILTVIFDQAIKLTFYREWDRSFSITDGSFSFRNTYFLHSFGVLARHDCSCPRLSFSPALMQNAGPVQLQGFELRDQADCWSFSLSFRCGDSRGRYFRPGRELFPFSMSESRS